MVSQRAVLFVDPPAFCTSVEERAAPALRSRPIAVAPPGAERATVLALSAEARRAGIEHGMAVRLARRLCPDLLVLAPNPQLYARASRALHQILGRYAPVIEPRGWGHAFLDLTGTGRLFGPPEDVAARIAREAHAGLRITLSVGVARNKLVSQTATTVGKREIGGDTPLVHVPSGEEAAFLAPRPVAMMPELHPRIRRRLDDYQLDLIGEVAALSEYALCAVFGASGRTLRARARGIDPRPVLPPERRAEFRLAHTLATDTNDLTVLHPLLQSLAERIGARLRQGGLAARRLRVELTYVDHDDATRAVPLPAAALDADLVRAARRALALAATRRVALRGVAVTAECLEEAGTQFELWDGSTVTSDGITDPESFGPFARLRARQGDNTGDNTVVDGPALQSALDQIRTRYGRRSMRRGLAATT